MTLARVGLSQNDTPSKGTFIENTFPSKDSLLNSNTIDEDNCLTPFNKKSTFNNFAIKFKILPWISLPSGSGINPSLGYEYGFSKNQSIGIDLYYNQYSFSSGDSYDSTKNQYVGRPRVSNRDKAIFLNYRYYLGFQKAREKGNTFYFGSFFRYGDLTFKYEEGYINKSNIIKENHYSLGIIYGLIHQIDCYKHGRQINIDTYFGIYTKQKVQFIEYTDSQNNLVKDKDYPVNIGIRIGLTLSLTGRR